MHGNIIKQWILQHCCKALCEAFANPKGHEDPEKEIEANYRVIAAILPQFQKLDFIPDVKDTQLLLLAELCIRIHKSNFYEEQNGSNQSNSTPFSECIIDVFKDHGVSDEKLSQLVIFFKKIQEAKRLRSKTLNERAEKVHKKFLNEIKVIIKGIIARYGPSFLEQIVDISNNVGSTTELTLNHSLDLMHQHMKEQSAFKPSEVEKSQPLKSKTTVNKRGTKKLYNPKRAFQLLDPESENNSNDDEDSSPVVVRAQNLPQIAGNRSSPRLSARKTNVSVAAAHTSTSATEAIQKHKKTSASTRSAHKEALDSAFGYSSGAESKTPNSKSKSARNQSFSATKRKSADREYALRSSKRKYDNFAAKSSDTVLQAANKDLDFDVNISIDSDVDVESNVEPNHEFCLENDEVFAETATSDAEGNMSKKDNSLVSFSSDDSIVEEANLPLPKVKPQKRRPFTQEEVDWLREGVSRFGVGRWRSILDSYNFKGRTTVNLKDKWRNLVKAGVA